MTMASLLPLFPIFMLLLPPSQKSSLTADLCRQDSDCNSVTIHRVCLFISSPNQFTPCNSRDPAPPSDTSCFCFPTAPSICGASTVCPDGEICAYTPLDDDPICAASTLVTSDKAGYVEFIPGSPRPISNTTPFSPQQTSVEAASSGVCIDAELTRHIPLEQLVYGKEGILAVVVCDGMGSCATKGHMVVWKGMAMRMVTYCVGIGGCEEREIMVNSPRWKWGTRVRSRTEGLQFTTFAARWESWGEELLLSGLVRGGL